MGTDLEAVSLSQSGWHNRFVQQALWTKALREYLYPQIGLDRAERVLEVGSGTGVILADLHGHTLSRIFGIDINRERLQFNALHTPGCHLAQSDGHFLPFASRTFDLSVCHLLLLWTANPQQVIQEMKRVTRTSGYVVAFAEPDYEARIDYPSELSRLGKWQQQALQKQGADPSLGRRLRGLFHQAGLKTVQAGVLGGQWNSPLSQKELQQEWQVLRSDVHEMVPEAILDELEQVDRIAWERGERVLFVPHFYAWGKVPE